MPPSAQRATTLALERAEDAADELARSLAADGADDRPGGTLHLLDLMSARPWTNKGLLLGIKRLFMRKTTTVAVGKEQKNSCEIQPMLPHELINISFLFYREQP